jgi:hypothetical protein
MSELVGFLLVAIVVIVTPGPTLRSRFRNAIAGGSTRGPAPRSAWRVSMSLIAAVRGRDRVDHGMPATSRDALLQGLLNASQATGISPHYGRGCDVRLNVAASSDRAAARALPQLPQQ